MQPDQYQPEGRKIFQDKSGRRRVFWIVLSLVVMAGIVGWIYDFVSRVYNFETLPVIERELRGAGVASLGLNAAFEEIGLNSADALDCAVLPPSTSAPQRFAYLPFDDAKARASFETHCGQIDAVLYDAFTFDAKTGRISALGAAIDVAGPLGYPMVRPMLGTPASVIEGMLANPVTRNGFLNNIARIGGETKAAGVCLDLTAYTEVSADALAPLLRGLKSDPQTSGRETCLIGAGDAGFWRNDALLQATDRAVVLGFREAGLPSTPPAPEDWFGDTIAEALAAISQEKLVVAVGSFGSLWRSGSAALTQISYAETMWMADRFQGEVGFAAGSGNTYVRFLDQQRRLNEIWLLDAVSLYNQIGMLPEGQNLAIWPLGYEDPTIWQVLDNTTPEVLEQPVSLANHIAIVGGGPFTALDRASHDGIRQIETNGGQAVVGQGYTDIPRPTTITRWGANPLSELVLTFNGIPDQDILPDFLDALNDRGIEATFFISGMGLLKRSEAAREIEAAGHRIGALTLLDNPSSDMARAQQKVSLNGMQHLLAHTTGHRTVFVRDLSGPREVLRNLDDLEKLSVLLDNGYLPVSSGISPQDGPFDQARFLDRVRVAGVNQRTAVLGFDITAPNAEDILASIPEMVDLLKRDGFRFTALDSLSGLEEAVLSPPTNIENRQDPITYSLLHFWYFNLSAVFLVLMVIATARALVYLVLAFVRRPSDHFDPRYHPPVTVLVPAFNEENVIERCIRSILNSNYPDLRVIVIDDGSADHTAPLVLEKFGDDPRVTLLHQENQGKWMAENSALDRVETPIFVGVDADTMVNPDAISWLVQRFKDERVGAVAGFVEVGNRQNFLTACQELEYLVSQSFARRAFEVFNGILVVPGAIGAWRTEAVRKAGKYSGNTITEDADLTVAIHRAGYLVKFQDQARAKTEAPATVAAFLKQRLRWVLGMLQTSWKHRGAITEGRTVGYISIMDAIWFSLLTSLLSPIVDILLLVIIVKVAFAAITGAASGLSEFPLIVIGTYFLLMGIDMVNTLAAFRFERKFDIKLLLLVPLLRFGYRQLMYISSLRAMGRAVSGRLPGWNKLSRTGTVREAPAKAQRVTKSTGAGDGE